MKKLGLVMAAAGMVMAALGGCGSNSDLGQIRVTWSQTLGGSNASCSAVGAAKFEVDVTEVDTLATDKFIYNCDQGAATLDPLPSGSYDMVAVLLDANNHEVTNFTDSLATPITIFGGDVENGPSFVFDFTASQGQFRVTWSETVQGSAASCASVSAVTFSITATNLATGQPDIFRYNCSQGGATLDALDAGDYSITASLLDAGDVEIAGPTPDITGTIDGGSITDLGNFAFDFQ